MKKLLLLVAFAAGALSATAVYLRLQARKDDAYGDEESDTFDLVAAFEGREFESRSQAFAGGSLLVVCAGAEIDLREAQLDPLGAYLDIDCWLGGIELKVPADWRVVLNAEAYLGGAENEMEELTAGLPDDAPTLEIDARIVLGGLDIQPVGTLGQEELTGATP